MIWQKTEVFEFGNKKRRQRLLISDSFDLGIGIPSIWDWGLQIADFNKNDQLQAAEVGSTSVPTIGQRPVSSIQYRASSIQHRASSNHLNDQNDPNDLNK